MEKETKYIITGIVLVAIITITITGGIVYSQKEKQASIERQVNAKIKAERIASDLEMEAKRELEEAKEDERLKKDCLAIFKTEDKKWNNVNSWWYVDYSNICRIEYKNPDYKEWDKKRMEEEGIEEYFTKGF